MTGGDEKIVSGDGEMNEIRREIAGLKEQLANFMNIFRSVSPVSCQICRIFHQSHCSIGNLQALHSDSLPNSPSPDVVATPPNVEKVEDEEPSAKKMKKISAGKISSPVAPLDLTKKAYLSLVKCDDVEFKKNLVDRSENESRISTNSIDIDSDTVQQISKANSDSKSLKEVKEILDSYNALGRKETMKLFNLTPTQFQKCCYPLNKRKKNRFKRSKQVEISSILQRKRSEKCAEKLFRDENEIFTADDRRIMYEVLDECDVQGANLTPRLVGFVAKGILNEFCRTYDVNHFGKRWCIQEFKKYIQQKNVEVV